MKAGFVYEKLTKFTEDSDPIKDMGIGRFRLKEDWERIFLGPIKEYTEHIEKLEGKTLTGVFTFFPGHFTRDVTVSFSTRDDEPITITVKSAKMYQGMNIRIQATNGKEYILEGEREYKIE